MEENSGLVVDIECKFVRTEPEVIDSIAKRIGADHTRVKSMMRYNMFTISQFSELSQLAESTILNKTRISVVDRRSGAIGTGLDYCFPFQSIKSPGPKFIVRNEKSEKYLK